MSLEHLKFFTIKIGGVSFKMRRRCTALMIDIGDLRSVLGIVPGANAKPDPDAKALDTSELLLAITKKAVKAALVSVDDVPADEITWDELEPVADALYRHFMTSGLDVDPTPDSSKAAKESQ